MALAFNAVTGSTNTTAAMVVGTGASLATSGSGTLTAKAFSGVLPLANGGRTLLDSQMSTSLLTGDSTDQVIWTYTLPANTIGAGEGVRIASRFTVGGGTSTTYALKFGGTTSFTTVSTSPGVHNILVYLFNKQGLTNAQLSMGLQTVSTTVIARFYADSAIDTTSPVVISWTFNVANTVTITTARRMWEVSIIH